MAELTSEKEKELATKVKRAPTKSSKKVVKVGSKFKKKDVTNGDGRDPKIDKEDAKVPTKGPDKFVKPEQDTVSQVIIRPTKDPEDFVDPDDPDNLDYQPDPQEQPIKVPSNLTFTDSTPVPTVAEEAEILANLAVNTRKNQNSVGLPTVSGASARTATTGFIANQEGLLGYASPVVFNNVVDGVISESELTQKVFNLQCQYKDLVYAITNKWRYGIFCSDDKDLIVEIRALLKLLVCYGVEGTAIQAGTDISEFSQNYADYITFGGVDLNDFEKLPAGITEGDYLFITSPFTNQYYILLVTGGTLLDGDLVPTANILNFLDQGWTDFSNNIYGLEYGSIESGSQADLDDALDAAQGVEIFASGLPDATLIKIVNKIEKLLQCSH